MKNCRIQISLICFIFVLSKSVLAQRINIFLDDTLNRRKFITNTELEHFNNYRIRSFIDFKEKLPDGFYYFISLNKSDSSRKNMNNYISIKGSYKDSLREGAFDYYINEKKGNKQIHHLSCEYNYKNGKLDGYYASWNSLGKEDEGYYLMGKRHGFFVSYNLNGSIQSIENYRNDSLKDWIKYYNGKVYASGFGKGGYLEGEYRQYNSDGKLFFLAFIQKGVVNKIVEYYPSGKIKREGEGVFENLMEVGIRRTPFYPLKLISGVIYEYDENGALISTERK